MDPLNSRYRTYFSPLTNGSSNANRIEAKEIYLIKTQHNGKPRFDNLALEQLDDADAKGLKKSLYNGVKKAIQLRTYQSIGKLVKLDLTLAGQTQTKFCINLKKNK